MVLNHVQPYLHLCLFVVLILAISVVSSYDLPSATLTQPTSSLESSSPYGSSSQSKNVWGPGQPSDKMSGDLIELNSLIPRPGSVRFSSRKPTIALVHGKRIRRGKRSLWNMNDPHNSHPSGPRDVCESYSDWVPIEESVDTYKNPVQVIQRIHINGTVVNQYFFQSFCHFPERRVQEENDIFEVSYKVEKDDKCKGIDENKWVSKCEEKTVWTYAKVRNTDNEIGWSMIAVSGPCSCSIWPKVTVPKKMREMVMRRRIALMPDRTKKAIQSTSDLQQDLNKESASSADYL